MEREVCVRGDKMKYKWLAVALGVTILAGCHNNVSESSNESSSVVEISLEAASESSTSTTDLPEKRFDGVRMAMTYYEDYAKPNEDGFAYYIVDDPDVSSEIMPLNEESKSNVVLFTFDDFPREPQSHALRMAKLLKSKGVGAIFLANGMYLQSEENRQLVKEIYDMGFEIGNHTQTHPNLRELTYEEQYAEIEETNRLIYEVTGEHVRWFRPPFGKFNMDTINICNELGLQLMTWSLGYDWMEEYQDGPALAKVSLESEYLRNGANILMHDLSWTADALETMIDGYNQRGYYIVDPYLIIRQKNSTEPMQR